jgi:hypothetical protein
MCIQQPLFPVEIVHSVIYSALQRNVSSSTWSRPPGNFEVGHEFWQGCGRGRVGNLVIQVAEMTKDGLLLAGRSTALNPQMNFRTKDELRHHGHASESTLMHSLGRGMFHNKE